MPLPNFFEAEAEANGATDVVGSGDGGVGRSGGSALVGTEVVVSSVFDNRVQVGLSFWRSFGPFPGQPLWDRKALEEKPGWSGREGHGRAVP